MKDNIVLIGMPGSGKSTAGVLLAKAIGYGFLDTDLLIQNERRALLCDILAEEGAEGFIAIEESVCARLWAEHCVIATGGSVVYLKLRVQTLENRLKNIWRRGVVTRRAGETVAELYEERVPLYEKWADVVVDCEGQGVEATVEAIARAAGVH